MLRNIRHTGIVVDDLDSSLFFYRDLLGMKVVRRMDEHGEYIDKVLSLHNVMVTTVKMSVADGQMIELLYYHSHPNGKEEKREIYSRGITHIAFTVDNLDVEYKKLLAEDVLFNASPQLSLDGAVKIAFCRAPEGTFIELVEVLHDA